MIDHMKYHYVSTDIGPKFPDREEKWSLSNHTPFISPYCGRMNPSPLPNHYPGNSSLTLSLSAVPEPSSPVGMCVEVSKSACQWSPAVTTPASVCLHGKMPTSSNEDCPSAATGTTGNSVNKSFDCEVEQSLNQALSNIFARQSSTDK